MERTIRINGKERRVEVDRSPGYFVVTVDGRRYEICDALLHGGMLNFFLGRKVCRVIISENGLGAQMTLNGRDYVIDVAGEEDESGGHAHHHGDGRVEAPMPGSITAVHVAKGDSVVVGQPLVVLESMKMQNEIASPVAGVVRAVNCKPGDQVGFGELLADITAEKS